MRRSILFQLVVIVVLVLLSCGIISFARYLATGDCAQYNAKPHFTHSTYYICVTPDGRIVG